MAAASQTTASSTTVGAVASRRCAAGLTAAAVAVAGTSSGAAFQFAPASGVGSSSGAGAQIQGPGVSLRASLAGETRVEGVQQPTTNKGANNSVPASFAVGAAAVAAAGVAGVRRRGRSEKVPSIQRRATSPSKAVPFLSVPRGLTNDPNNTSYPGDFGFDPLGFASDRSPLNEVDEYMNEVAKNFGLEGFSKLRWYREAELMHGRVCMLAVFNIIIRETGNIFDIVPDETLETSAEAVLQFASVMVVLEAYRGSRLLVDTNRLAGDLGLGMGPGDALAKEMTLEELAVKQVRELQNSRLAMVAFVGMVVAYLQTGHYVLQQDQVVKLQETLEKVAFQDLASLEEFFSPFLTVLFGVLVVDGARRLAATDETVAKKMAGNSIAKKALNPLALNFGVQDPGVPLPDGVAAGQLPQHLNITPEQIVEFEEDGVIMIKCQSAPKLGVIAMAAALGAAATAQSAASAGLQEHQVSFASAEWAAGGVANSHVMQSVAYGRSPGAVAAAGGGATGATAVVAHNPGVYAGQPQAAHAAGYWGSAPHVVAACAGGPGITVEVAHSLGTHAGQPPVAQAAGVWNSASASQYHTSTSVAPGQSTAPAAWFSAGVGWQSSSVPLGAMPMTSPTPAVSSQAASAQESAPCNSTPAAQLESAASSAISPVSSSHGKPRSLAQEEQMLKNYRLRRKLGLLPKSEATADSQAESLRWIRHTWRPHRLGVSHMDGDAAVAGDTSNAMDILAEVAELQGRVEKNYGTLNAERRRYAADSEALRRQGESVATINAEVASLRAQLDEVRREVQQKTATNSELSVRLGLARENQAKSQTQAAVLARTVNGLIRGSSSAAGCRSTIGSESAMPAPVAAVLSARGELAIMKAQIAFLTEENASLGKLSCQAPLDGLSRATVVS